MEKNIFVFFSVVLSVVFVLFAFVQLYAVAIIGQLLSVVIVSFLYQGTNEDEKIMFYGKSVLFAGTMIVFLYFIFSGEAGRFAGVLMSVSILFNILIAKEVRENRGWPRLFS